MYMQETHYTYDSMLLYLKIYLKLIINFLFFDVGLQNIRFLIKCLCKTNNKRTPKI